VHKLVTTDNTWSCYLYQFKKQDMQCMYKCNIEVHSCNHCRNGKAISITYSECAFVALVIQHTTHMCHISICDLLHSTIFFPHYLTNGTI